MKFVGYQSDDGGLEKLLSKEDCDWLASNGYNAPKVFKWKYNKGGFFPFQNGIVIVEDFAGLVKSYLVNSFGVIILSGKAPKVEVENVIDPYHDGSLLYFFKNAKKDPRKNLVYDWNGTILKHTTYKESNLIGYKGSTLVDKHALIYIVDEDNNIFGFFSGKNLIWNSECPLTKNIVMIAMDSWRIKSSFPYNKSKTKIGLDLEFQIIDSEDLLHEATEFVGDNLADAIGTDGFVKTLEIRPEATSTASELFKNTKSLIKAIDDVLPEGYDLLAGGGGGDGCSIGTHIHFSGYPSDSRLNLASPSEPIKILDNLIYGFIKRCPSWQRADPEHYGKYGSFRNRANPGTDGDFPHEGFEWRGLPNICVKEKLFESILLMSEAIMQTWASGITIVFPDHYAMGTPVRLEDYSDLKNFDEIKDNISYFVDFVNSESNLRGRILENWFRGKHSKREGAEIRIYPVGIFQENTVPLTMFHERQIADKCIVGISETNRFTVAHNIMSVPTLIRFLKRLGKFITTDMGRNLEVIEWSSSIQSTAEAKLGRGVKGSILFIGIPEGVYEREKRRNRVSRDYVKMLVQLLIRNM